MRNPIRKATAALSRLSDMIEVIADPRGKRRPEPQALHRIHADLVEAVRLLGTLAQEHRTLGHQYATLAAAVTNEVSLPPGGLIDQLRKQLEQHPDRRCPCCLRSPVSTKTWDRLTRQDELIRDLQGQLAHLRKQHGDGPRGKRWVLENYLVPLENAARRGWWDWLATVESKEFEEILEAAEFFPDLHDRLTAIQVSYEKSKLKEK